ncbi:MAG TPA: hypothetical protein VK922_18295 [Gemmatimonadaceae bacterium]|nr:hypothetical protein [Gemmatimonadaceae bacterium]
MRTITALPRTAVTILAGSMLVGCEREPVGVENVDAPRPALAAVKVAASGAFAQSAITSLDVQSAGGNTIITQTSDGSISGTLSGPFHDDLKVVIHPNGKFNAHFTITCTCTVGGKSGVLEFVASDTGELLSPTLAAFAGRAVIKGGTGDLSGLHGVLQIEGTVDVTTGLSTYGYSGTLHWQP